MFPRRNHPACSCAPVTVTTHRVGRVLGGHSKRVSGGFNLSGIEANLIHDEAIHVGLAQPSRGLICCRLGHVSSVHYREDPGSELCAKIMANPERPGRSGVLACQVAITCEAIERLAGVRPKSICGKRRCGKDDRVTTCHFCCTRILSLGRESLRWRESFFFWGGPSICLSHGSSCEKPMLTSENEQCGGTSSINHLVAVGR